ncbi:Putative Zn-dependent protease, contains TPR repeats [Cribrihabitans marinus]|uniref:Putative Zn-dependent protease, contains TPR repeats n=2 Tax=Cribrihabitans marinus TaxID=1227549 RepID=A0A1H6QWT0_9RHOB|nr:Putative Zn-dependent protease, contains TPR repeats [Cribrihabitans marinus]
MDLKRGTRRTSIPTLVLGLALCLLTALPARALTLLRDPDIENGLRELAFPVLRAAGLNPKRVKILLVNDGKFNAFVLDHNAIFLNYGLILKVDRADVLQAVIAHEAAHIANGHIARRMQNLQSARNAAGLGLALAILAGAAGAGEAAAGIATGTQSSALRSFLSHTRAEESAADRTAASLLRASDIDLQGLVDLHRAFAGQENLSPAAQDPYMRSHPLTRDRLRAAESYLDAAGPQPDTRPETAYWFARIQGKVSAFTRSPKWTQRRATNERHADIRHMRLAIAHHRSQNLGAARREIDRALALRPEDPFYYELKGQILIENRRVGEAVAAYGRAVDLAPTEPLILAGYGRALLASGKPDAALEVLERARARDYRDTRMMRDLAMAYARSGQNGMASLVTAERYALQGRMDDAQIHAKRAIGQLPTGSTGWQRAEDVLIATENAEKRKR